MTGSETRALTLATLGAVITLTALYAAGSVPFPAFVAALVCLSVLAAWKPAAMLGMICLTLPLFHEPITIGSQTYPPSELLLACTAAGTLIRFVYLGSFDNFMKSPIATIRQSTARFRDPFTMVAFAGLGVLSLIGVALLTLSVDDAEARAAGLREWRWTLFEPLLFVGLLTWHISTWGTRRILIGAYLAGATLAAFWGIASALLGDGVSAGGVVRARGFFPHPNAFALYLLRAVVFAASLYILGRSRNILRLGFLAAGGAALILSFSRSAALGLIVAGVLLWSRVSPRVRAVAVGAAVVGGLALLIVASDRSVGESGTDSLALRADIWRSGAEMIRDRPITGYGPDQFLYVYSPRYIDSAAWAERFTAHGHNLLIDAWVRTGIIGAVLALAALLAIAKETRTLRAVTGVAGPRNVRLSAAIALAAASVQGMVDNGYFVHDLAMSGWFLAWIVFGRSTTDEPGRSPTL